MQALIGINIRNFVRVLRENRFRIHPSKMGSLAMLALISTRNSIYARKERKQYNEQIESVEITESPVFLLGHWRSGTSLFHQLLTLNERFAYPSLFETYNPFTFLTVLPRFQERVKKLQSIKRPMDNMKIQITGPAEDEFALSVLSLCSPLLGWSFPEKEDYYDRYLSFDDCSEAEVDRWKQAFMFFLKKLTLHHQKPLILKSPHHTARIRLILDMFPSARFIHLHRDPYIVFKSTRNLYRKTVSGLHLQKRPADTALEQSIIDRYATLYDAYFRDRERIPSGQLYELGFQDLAKDFEGEIKKIYDHFGWESWDSYKSQLLNYLKENKNYKKNVYDDIEEPWKSQIQQKWKRYFDIWGYKI